MNTLRLETEQIATRSVADNLCPAEHQLIIPSLAATAGALDGLQPGLSNASRAQSAVLC